MIRTQVYSNQRFALDDVTVEDLPNLRSDPAAFLWVDLENPSDAEARKILEEIFAFHPIAVEDCLTDSPYSKIESFDDVIYVVLHVLRPDEGGFKPVEIDAFLGKDFLVTFHRHSIAEIDTTFKRYARNDGPIVRGPDRFFHSLFDLIISNTKPHLDEFRRKVERIQENVLKNEPAEVLFPKVISLRKQTTRLRGSLRPQHVIANELAHGKHKVVRSALQPYFRDLAEDIARMEAETVGWAEQLILSFRIYLNKSSHDANAGIRILTGITALTFPMILIGGWFGMNFDNMHELHTRTGYPIAVVIMVACTAATWLFMRKKRWL